MNSNLNEHDFTNQNNDDFSIRRREEVYYPGWEIDAFNSLDIEFVEKFQKISDPYIQQFMLSQPEWDREDKGYVLYDSLLLQFYDAFMLGLAAYWQEKFIGEDASEIKYYMVDPSVELQNNDIDIMSANQSNNLSVPNKSYNAIQAFYSEIGGLMDRIIDAYFANEYVANDESKESQLTHLRHFNRHRRRRLRGSRARYHRKPC